MTARKPLACLWALVVALLLAHNAYLWLAQRIVPDTDILALLPVQQRDPVLQQSFTHMVDAAQQRVIVMVGAADWEQAKQAADAYAAVLASRPDLLAASKLDDATQGDWLALFQKHRLTLLTAQQEQQLRSQPAGFWLDSALSKLYGAFSGPKLGSFQDDPFGLFAGWVQQRAQETPVRPRDGRLFVADAERQYVLLPMLLKPPAFSLGAQEAVIPLLERAWMASLQAQPQAQVITAGVVLHAAAAARQAGSEVSTIGLGSLLGIVLLMWLSFHSLRPIGLILLSIAIGFLGALSLSWLLFGRIHLLTLVFGASLIGVAQDYGIYFLCNRLHADPAQDSRALLRQLMPGLALTLLTTVIGYMGLAFTPFPGLRQMALFSGMGLVFAWLTVICWFPLLLAGGTLKSSPLLRWYGKALAYWPRVGRNKPSAVMLLLFAVAAAVGCMRLGVNDDIRLLQTPQKHLLDDQIKLGRLLDAPTPVQYFLVRGRSAEVLLQTEEALKTRLEPLIAAGSISGYQAISNWVPSMQAQQRRRTLLDEKILNDSGPLALLARKIGEDQSWSAAIGRTLRSSEAPFTVDEFMASAASEPWRHLWLGRIDGVYASIVAVRGLRPASVAQLQHAAAGLPAVQWVDKVGEISSVLGSYRRYMGWVLLAGYALVFGLLSVRYRHQAWRALLPTALASTAALATLGFCAQQLQLFHVLALMLLLGVGVDYGIFMQESAGRPRTTPWLAVGLSAVSTILSFGLLGLSRTPALQAFGLTMLAGTVFVWLLTPCFTNMNTNAKDAP